MSKSKLFRFGEFSQLLTKLQDAPTFPCTIRQILSDGIFLKAKKKRFYDTLNLKKVKFSTETSAIRHFDK
ncbi:hypothetical protein [Algoriphagus sp.]|uniref:hypothetical protein n=1 Tax=Algoriphagus sp. TaxID=1872435 RepID=UPI003F6FEB48